MGLPKIPFKKRKKENEGEKQKEESSPTNKATEESGSRQAKEQHTQ